MVKYISKIRDYFLVLQILIQNKATIFTDGKNNNNILAKIIVTFFQSVQISQSVMRLDVTWQQLTEKIVFKQGNL